MGDSGNSRGSRVATLGSLLLYLGPSRNLGATNIIKGSSDRLVRRLKFVCSPFQVIDRPSGLLSGLNSTRGQIFAFVSRVKLQISSPRKVLADGPCWFYSHDASIWRHKCDSRIATFKFATNLHFVWPAQSLVCLVPLIMSIEAAILDARREHASDSWAKMG